MLHRPSSLSFWKRLQAACFLWLGKVHRHYGIVLGSQAEFARAIGCYGRALALDPTLSQAHLERGILLWRELGQSSQAVADFNAALALRPGWPEPIFCRGMAHQSMGNYRAAIQDLAAYIASDDQTWRDHAVRQLALIRALLQEGEQA
jgi:tetratricopeptide (TPR) repeat protein